MFDIEIYSDLIEIVNVSTETISHTFLCHTSLLIMGLLNGSWSGYSWQRPYKSLFVKSARKRFDGSRFNVRLERPKVW